MDNTLLKNAIGKTIVAVDDSSINCLTITFNDESVILLEAENASGNLLAISQYNNSERQLAGKT